MKDGSDRKMYQRWREKGRKEVKLGKKNEIQKSRGHA